MILEDLLAQYVPSAQHSAFLQTQEHLVAKLGQELGEAEVSAIAQAALDFLGISQANTPHVTNVAAADLPPAEPVWAPAPVETAAPATEGAYTGSEVIDVSPQA